jgi:PAS domain-containing protein
MCETSGWKGECAVSRPDGADLSVSLSLAPVKDGKGRVVGSFAIAHDITEQKHNEEVLRQNEAQFRELAEHIRAVFFVSTPQPFAIT